MTPIEKSYKKFVKEVDPLTLVLASEQMIAKAREIKANEEAVREQYKNSIVHPSAIIRMADSVLEHFAKEGA